MGTNGIKGSQHGLDRNVLYLMSLLQRNTREYFVRLIEDYNVTTPMFSVLFEINAGPSDVTSSELARRAYVSPQSINQVVQRLVERGLVHREPLGPGRRLALTLTDTGKELLQQLVQAQRQVLDDTFRHAPVLEEEFRQSLAKLVISLNRSREEDS